MFKLLYLYIALTLMLVTPMCNAQNGIVFTKRLAPYGLVGFEANFQPINMGSKRHIDGYVKSYTSGRFIFPVGDNGIYRPFAISANGTIGAYFAANPSIAITSDVNGASYPALPAGAPFPITAKSVEVKSVSSKEYWDINGNVASRITLTWGVESNLTELLSGSLSNLCLVGWANNTWVTIPAQIDAMALLGGSSSITSGSITTVNAIVPNSYNVYSLGSIEGGALPVTLIRFIVTGKEGIAELSWTTGNEMNSKYFEIEYSIDGKFWNKIGSMVAKGTSEVKEEYSFLHMNPASGVNYYRLKMIDRDDSYAYSQIKSLNLDFVSGLTIYPNPASDRVYISGKGRDQITNVTLIDVAGRIVKTTTNISIQGIEVRGLPVGIYVLKVTDYFGTTNSYKVVINH